MSDFRDIQTQAFLDGKILDSCGSPDRDYSWGLYTDLCGMSYEEARDVVAKPVVYCKHEDTGETKTTNIVTLVLEETENEEYAVVFKPQFGPTVDILVSLTVDGVPMSATIPAGSTKYVSTITVPSKYASVENINFITQDSVYTYKANNTIKDGKFTLTYLIDGSIYSSEQIKCGTLIVAPVPDEKIGYTFNWVDPIPSTMPEADLIINGKYTVNTYYLTLVNDDKVETIPFEYNEPIVGIEEPSKKGYTFIQWEPVIPERMPANDLRCSAIFEINTYEIKFVNDNGEILQVSNVEYGVLPKYEGETPLKESTEEFNYVFNDWDKAIVEAESNTTYTATFTPILRSYNVKFMNETEVLQESIVNYGEMPSFDGEEPTKESDIKYDYTFEGWEPAITIVKGDIIYNAKFISQLRKYEIKYLNWDNSLLYSNEFEFGATPSYEGEMPRRESDLTYDYRFKGWYPEVTEVTGPASYKAEFDKDYINYLVRFENSDGSVLDEYLAHYGDAVKYNGSTPTREKTESKIFIFKGWNKPIEGAVVEGNVTYTAIYDEEVRKYSVKFVNYDSSELATYEVAYGSIPRYSEEEPIRKADETYTYEFKGWSPEIGIVTNDVVYTAQYNANYIEYLVSFYDEDGTPLVEGIKYHYGEMPSDIEHPRKESTEEYDYEFESWQPELSPVTSNTDYYAYYKAIVKNYEVKFVDYDGTLIHKENVPYGQKPAYYIIPTREKDESYTYTFDGWEPEVTTVPEVLEYRATYKAEKVKYDLTFEVNGEISGPYLVAWGEEVNQYYPSTPSYIKDGKTYVFSSWSESLNNEMPKHSVLLVAQYVEKTEAKTIYYGTYPDITIDDFNSIEDLNNKNSFDYNEREEKDVTFIIPGNEEYLEIETDEELEEWEATHDFDFITVIPSGKSLKWTDDIGSVQTYKKIKDMIIEGNEYVAYCVTGDGACVQIDEPIDYKHKLTIN